MTLVVQKFGGTSVGTIERILHVADRIVRTRAQGHRAVVVLSAMSGETDRLIRMAREISKRPDAREFDALVSTGESVSAALLSMALREKGHAARSYSGRQAGILTTEVHKKARIKSIDTDAIKRVLDEGIIPVVTGFQGVDSQGNVTTLGRGGSDTSAVALAAALQADECQIYTDVEGVYTTDPRVEPNARRLSRITFEEMLELASLGSKVLQIRSVEFAGKYNVPIRVLSSFVEGQGTLISYEDKRMEQALISGIAFDRNQAKLTLLGVPDQPGVAGRIFTAISDANIDVDVIVQSAPVGGLIDFSFTLQRDDYPEAYELVSQLSKELSIKEIVGDENVAKLSIVGVGMRSHPGIASTMFNALSQENINIYLISTSEIKVSVIIHEDQMEAGVKLLHHAFNLAG